MKTPEFITVDSVSAAGLPPIKKVFVDGVEIPEVEVACPERGFVVAGALNEHGTLFVLPETDGLVAKHLVQGEVTFEYRDER